MITFLKKRKHAKTPKTHMLSNRVNQFKKPIIRIINNEENTIENTELNNKPEIIKEKVSNILNKFDDDSDDEIEFNTSKISSISDKFKMKKGDIKKHILSNAVLVKELLVKAVDKHKLEMCTQMASQLVEVYNKKHAKDEADRVPPLIDGADSSAADSSAADSSAADSSEADPGAADRVPPLRDDAVEKHVNKN